jgi:hypothetical protein
VLLAGWLLTVVGSVVFLAGPDVPGGFVAAAGGLILVVRALISLRDATELKVARAVVLLLVGGWVTVIGLMVAASA